MGYIKNHLLPEEKVIYRGEMSGWYLFPVILSNILSIILAYFGYEYYQKTDEGIIIFCVAAIWFIVSFIRVLGRLIDKLTSEFVITDKRCVLKQGLISISVLDMALDKCEGISFSQGLWGRLFQFGKLSATTGGSASSFDGMDKPFQFRNKLYEVIETYKKQA